MALKFRKRVRVFPGFYLNLSKSGMSATVGMRGLNVNIGKKGMFLNTGIPGTGLYDRVRLDGKKARGTTGHDTQRPFVTTLPDDAVEIKSYQPALLTSEGLFGLKESIRNAQKVKEELRQESQAISLQKTLALLLLIFSYVCIVSIFIKWFKENYNIKKSMAKDAQDAYDNFKLDIEFHMDQSLLNEYITLKKYYAQLMHVDTIWDITSTKAVNRVKERSTAASSITRSAVKFSTSSLDYINTSYEALRFQNANGGDLFVYPGFLVMADKKNDEFALIDFREITMTHHEQRFIETERVPRDTKIVGHTWKYVNKNGSPDKRYKDNFEIPIALYYEMTLESSKGLYESYQFSNPDIGQIFCHAFESYKDSLQKMQWKNEAKQEIEDMLEV